MIDPIEFVKALRASGVDFFTGVPDSLLKSVCACIAVEAEQQHQSATNEGSAVGLALGWYLGTGRPALVYMQNSGLGNAVNPITSLADSQVYGVPMVLLVGWRGEVVDGAQLVDEPQHVKQGAITPNLLDVLGVPFAVIGPDTANYAEVIAELCALASARRGPVALLVRKDTFRAFAPPPDPTTGFGMTREDAIRIIIETLPPQTRVVATTGMASRELFELRRARSEDHDHDFLTVGGMGHASQIAAGLATARPGQRVLCLDGDGAMLMHTGALAVSAGVRNLVHVVLNNQRHDSVGGQPTHASHLDLAAIASSFGYQHVASVTSADELALQIARCFATNENWFLEAMCRPGARGDLGRPDRTPRENIDGFMSHLGVGKDRDE